jgi:hypothetical protein
LLFVESLKSGFLLKILDVSGVSCKTVAV